MDSQLQSVAPGCVRNVVFCSLESLSTWTQVSLLCVSPAAAAQFGQKIIGESGDEEISVKLMSNKPVLLIIVKPLFITGAIKAILLLGKKAFLGGF